MTEAPDCAGIVLAGGASRRMGRDKAVLMLSDECSMLDRARATLSKLGASPVLVSGTRADCADAIADLQAGLGPLGGIASVVAARPELRGRLLLVLPVDVPGLRAADLRWLVVAAQTAPGAHFATHPLPLALWLDARAAAYLMAVLDGEVGRAVHAMASQLGYIAVPAAAVDLRNVNTPEDWSAFRQPAP